MKTLLALVFGFAFLFLAGGAAAQQPLQDNLMYALLEAGYRSPACTEDPTSAACHNEWRLRWAQTQALLQDLGEGESRYPLVWTPDGYVVQQVPDWHLLCLLNSGWSMECGAPLVKPTPAGNRVFGEVFILAATVNDVYRQTIPVGVWEEIVYLFVDILFKSTSTPVCSITPGSYISLALYQSGPREFLLSLVWDKDFPEDIRVACDGKTMSIKLK